MSADKIEEQTTIEAGAEVTVAKNTKKAIKALKGTGVKKVDGINRVVIRKRQGPVFVIESPEVYRTPNGSYIVFGEAQVQQQDFAKQLASMTGKDGEAAADKSPEAIQADLAAQAEQPKIEQAEEDIPDDEVDTTGLDEEMVKLVQEQANVSKAKAVKAFRDNNGDTANALMQLTI